MNLEIDAIFLCKILWDCTKWQQKDFNSNVQKWYKRFLMKLKYWNDSPIYDWMRIWIGWWRQNLSFNYSIRFVVFPSWILLCIRLILCAFKKGIEAEEDAIQNLQTNSLSYHTHGLNLFISMLWCKSTFWSLLTSSIRSIFVCLSACCWSNVLLSLNLLQFLYWFIYLSVFCRPILLPCHFLQNNEYTNTQLKH